MSYFKCPFSFMLIHAVTITTIAAQVTDKNPRSSALICSHLYNIDSANFTKCSNLPAEFMYFLPKHSHLVFNLLCMSVILIISLHSNNKGQQLLRNQIQLNDFIEMCPFLYIKTVHSTLMLFDHFKLAASCTLQHHLVVSLSQTCCIISTSTTHVGSTILLCVTLNFRS